MNFIKYLSPILLVLILSGCTSMKYNYQPMKSNISFPPNNETRTSFVGDYLVKQGTTQKHTIMNLTNPINISAYTLSSGDYIKKGDDIESNYFYPYNGSQITKMFLADPITGLQVPKGQKKICVITVMNIGVCGEAEYTLEDKEIASSNSFQQTLIYSGKIGNKINISYREFSSSMARPAFNNDVTYDLSESNIIGYKGARLKVIEATNEYLKYVVLKNFNQ